MNHSTENVTLLAQFITDVLTAVEALNLQIDSEFVAEIKTKADLTDPYNQVPMQAYNDLCAWVEQHLGRDAIVSVGEQIGKTVYQILLENNLISELASVEEILGGLEIAASSTIQDPQERGWDILENGTNTALMRRTQTFNSLLQFGLLYGLVAQAPAIDVDSIDIFYEKSIAQGDDFDEYRIKWSMN
ncbi:hypothetical protein [Hugenholtzia roseola]|uniref:hypothetical protein n=1 Tax=Hugenholtzia roseola TaxID=1002 RepID=UPI0004069E08|nr:hypothetical protein [Hugenholtzia roseola]